MVATYITSQTFARPQGRSMARTIQEKGKVGRKKSPGGPLEEWTVGFKPNVLKTLVDMSVEEETSIPDIVRKAVDAYLSPQPVRVTSLDLKGGPLLDVRVACGPNLAASEDSSDTFMISKAVADEIGFDEESSFFARTRGESMEGAGIMDEYVICFTPLASGRKPRFPQIALIACEDEEGNVSGTVKRWKGERDNAPILLDGNGEEFPLPEGTVKAWPVAIAKGVVGGLV